MLIELDSLHVSYGRHEVLKGLDLRTEGQAVGLLGPNGAGKTTLLKVLLGFLPPTEGEARLMGLDPRIQALEIRQQIGYMPENDCFIGGMNAVTYVAYAGELCGMPRADAVRRAHEVLQYVGLGEARYRSLETYSSGMRQRLKLAQALVHDPALLFLDEPTNGMDPLGREQMLNLIRDISYEKGMHTLLSSHLLPDVEFVCQEVIVLHRGQVAVQGNIEELKKNAQRIFDLRIRGPQETFVKALADAGCEWRSLEDGILRVSLPETFTARAFFEIAHRCGCQVRYLRQIQHSLEEVFAQAVNSDP